MLLNAVFRASDWVSGCDACLMNPSTVSNPHLACHHFNNRTWIIHCAPAQRLHMICSGGVTQSHTAQPSPLQQPWCWPSGASRGAWHHPQKVRSFHRLRCSAALQSSPQSAIQAPKTGAGPDSMGQEKKQNYWSPKDYFEVSSIKSLSLSISVFCDASQSS